jgi:hypothetical protein
MKLMVCDSPNITNKGVLKCSDWQLVDLESLVTQEQFFQLSELFVFDPVTFGLITSGLILTFVTGHVTGSIARIMSRA